MKHTLAIAAVAALAFVSSNASAAPVAGVAVTVQPALSTDDVERGGFTSWGAWGVGQRGGYVGFEVAAGNYDVPNDFGLALHVLGGVAMRLSDRVVVLADAGAGVTQQTSYKLRIFSSQDEGGFESVQVLPSAVTRVQLVGELGTVGRTTVGLALASEARVGLFPSDDELATGALGLGLGLYLAR